MVKLPMKAARVAAGYTQEAMAKAMGVSRVTYNKWETGKTPIRTPELFMFCHIVNMEEDDILLPIRST